MQNLHLVTYHTLVVVAVVMPHCGRFMGISGCSRNIRNAQWISQSYVGKAHPSCPSSVTHLPLLFHSLGSSRLLRCCQTQQYFSRKGNIVKQPAPGAGGSPQSVVQNFIWSTRKADNFGCKGGQGWNSETHWINNNISFGHRKRIAIDGRGGGGLSTVQ